MKKRIINMFIIILSRIYKHLWEMYKAESLLHWPGFDSCLMLLYQRRKQMNIYFKKFINLVGHNIKCF